MRGREGQAAEEQPPRETQAHSFPTWVAETREGSWEKSGDLY